MRSKVCLTTFLTALFVIASGCGTAKNCPVCGTTSNGAYAVINVIPVPEHNPTGEPGGPFNSFDISTIAPNPTGTGGPYLDYISDRIGLDMVVIDTSQDIAVNAIQGSNAVADGGNGASPCATITQPGSNPPATVSVIPPIISVFGNFTRYGCRTDLSWEGGIPFHLGSGFGANGNFGGFPGAQCCAARANGVNPMSGPDGNTTTPDGKFLFVGNGSSSFVVFDLTTMSLSTNPPTPPTVVADIPTGVSADYDGPLGIAPCVSSWNGEAGSAADCGDDRGDEQALGTVKDASGTEHQVLAIINGDPGLPFVSFFDVTNIVNKTGTAQQQHCLPIDQTYPYGPYAAPAQTTADPTDFPSYPSQGFSETWVIPQTGAAFNPPSCLLGQIYYDGAGGAASGGVGLTGTVPVDNVGATFPCPDPSNPQTFGGISGSAAASMIPGIGITPLTHTLYTLPCHHGPIVSYVTGNYCAGANAAANATGTQTPPFSDSTCAGAIAPAGLGAMAFDPNTGYVLLTNSNSIATTNIGNVDVINLQLGTGNGPVVVGSIVTPNCMPTSMVQGPGESFLVGCADHDGEAFPANEYIINLSGGFNATTGYNVNCVSSPMVNCVQIHNTGGVDEVWYNPGDNKYYLAARDLSTGAAMGVIDAATNQWLVNFPTGSNSHSIAVDPSTNQAFVPMQAGTICTTQSANGCVGVVAEQ
ncbi:MAG TPA: hypothetical protein VK722_22380 [Candidatus Aquilonibacter sp.]|jgi:hypothetical protein|nr:hypothetical protein [Candidatus Aquilonibacter sp.]